MNKEKSRETKLIPNNDKEVIKDSVSTNQIPSSTNPSRSQEKPKKNESDKK